VRLCEPAMDRILISGLQFFGHHGVSEEERRLGSHFRVDAEIEFDLTRPAASDDLGDTIDYGEVCRTLLKVGNQRQHHLLESLAEDMARAILLRFRPRSVILRLRKLDPPLDAHLEFVGVEIKRGRDDQSVSGDRVQSG